MSHEVLIPKLNEIARKVWPDTDLYVFAEPGCAWVFKEMRHKHLELACIRHPRALEALEAALLALAEGL